MLSKNWYIKEENGKNHFLPIKNKLTIGRSRQSDIQIKNFYTSRLHSTIELDGEIPLLTNHSWKGTSLNQNKILFAKILKNGDKIIIEKNILTINNINDQKINETINIDETETISISSDDESLTLSEMYREQKKMDNQTLNTSSSEKSSNFEIEQFSDKKEKKWKWETDSDSGKDPWAKIKTLPSKNKTKTTKYSVSPQSKADSTPTKYYPFSPNFDQEISTSSYEENSLENKTYPSPGYSPISPNHEQEISTSSYQEKPPKKNVHPSPEYYPISPSKEEKPKRKSSDKINFNACPVQ